MNKVDNKYLINHEYFNTCQDDTTSFMDMVIYSAVKFASDSYFKPTVYHFCATTSDSIIAKVTNLNKIVDLEIPIIPVEYYIGNPAEIDNFFKNGTQENIKKRQDKIGETELKKRILNYTNRIINYIYYSLSMAYLQAISNSDGKRMKVIKNLDMMKDFDFESLQVLYKANFRISADNQGKYYYNQNGQRVNVSTDMFDRLTKILNLYKKAQKDSDTFKQINKRLETFNPYISKPQSGE